jgi:uncharacterized protein
VVKAGDIVKVKVMEVDLQRKRIALTMRLDEQPGDSNARRGGGGDREQGSARPRKPQTARSRGAACGQQRDDGCAGGGDG